MERAERNRYLRRAASRWLAVVSAAAAALTVDWLFNSSLATATFFFGVLASVLYRLWQTERSRSN